MKEEFPILKNNSDMVYLDSAATSQKPQVVLDTIMEMYKQYNANVHRGIYPLSVHASQKVEKARQRIAEFFHTSSEHIIFTKNTTESINLLSRSIKVEADENIVTTEIEHHSNFVPWQELAKRSQAELRIARYDKDKHNIQPIQDLVDEKTKIVSFTGMSNVSGQILDVKNMITAIREKNSNTIIIVDACQWAVHKEIDVEDVDADYVTCSAHKMYGPLGVGILYAKSLENLDPFLFGGDMIESVNLEVSTYQTGPSKFEAGTLDIAGIVATAKACEFMSQKREKIESLERELTNYALEKLRSIEGIQIVGHQGEDAVGIISFYHKEVPAFDIASLCAAKNICLRIGQHCAEPFLKALEVHATLRISFAAYNTKEDIDIAIHCIQDTISRLTKNKE